MALTATLTPEYIDDPKSPRGPYSVRGKDGPRFKIWPDKMDGVEKGKPIVVTYEEKKNSYNGKEYTDNVVLSVVGVAVVPSVFATAPDTATNGHARNSYNNNPGAAVMGVVNQFVGIGTVKPFEHGSLSKLIDWVEGEYAQSKLGIPF